MTIQMKSTEQYFPVVLFITLYKVVLTFETANVYKHVIGNFHCLGDDK